MKRFYTKTFFQQGLSFYKSLKHKLLEDLIAFQSNKDLHRYFGILCIAFFIVLVNLQIAKLHVTGEWPHVITQQLKSTLSLQFT